MSAYIKNTFGSQIEAAFKAPTEEQVQIYFWCKNV